MFENFALKLTLSLGQKEELKGRSSSLVHVVTLIGFFKRQATYLPSGKPSTSTRFPHGFMRDFQGIIPMGISSSFPCKNLGETNEYFQNVNNSVIIGLTMGQFLGELKGSQIRENFPLISTRNFGRNLGYVSVYKFPNGFSTAYNK